ncbi:MAG: PAS domain-containing sensor histidine kinase, partial [Chthoniobacteraceae bacterium]
MTELPAMTNSTVPRTADGQELSALAAAISGAVIRLGSDRSVQSWSDGARELFGLQAEEILGNCVDALMDRSGRAPYLVALAEAAESGIPAQIETKLLRRCGTAFPASVELGAICGTAGERAGWVTITRDLSGEQERVAALLEWKARYEAAIKVSGMILRDWKPEEDQVTCAGNVEAILGEPIARLKGGIEGWAELIHPEDREAFFHEFETMLAKRTPFELEYRLRTKSGAYTIVRDRGHLFFDADDRIVRVAAVITDISEQRALEDRLRHSQKMEAFGRLAGGVAHDFNNLLTVISGYTELMKEDTSADDPRNMLVTEIEKAATRASSLTAQLLAFSRQQVLKLCVLNLNDVLADVGRMLRRLIGEHIRLQLQPAQTLGFVKGDLGQLEQVLINLAVNARDAMPNGGTLTITTEDVRLTEELKSGRLDLSPGDYVLLTVSDTGVGMTREVLAQVFEPFFTTKAPGHGTGLGLATCYGIIHQSGGQIGVQSEAGKGTTFRIYLPRAKEVEVRETQSAPRAIQGGSERILL